MKYFYLSSILALPWASPASSQDKGHVEAGLVNDFSKDLVECSGAYSANVILRGYFS